MKQIWRKSEFLVVLVIVVLSTLIGIIAPTFFSFENLFDMMKNCVIIGIFATAVLLVLISGGIDVSFPAIAAFCMYLTTIILNSFHYNGSVIIAFITACVIGIVLGCINATLISFLRLPTLIVTLGTSNIFQGFLLAIIGTTIINILPAGMVNFSKMYLIKITSSNGSTYGFSILVVVLMVVLFAVWYLLKHTVLGRKIYAIGGNRQTAERLGINVSKIQFFVYSIAGLIAGMGGIVHACTVRAANPFDIVGTELNIIAAVVLGGARISGGHGTVLGTILGVILVVIISNSLILMHIPSYWQSAVVGLLILIGTGFTALQTKREVRSVNEVN